MNKELATAILNQIERKKEIKKWKTLAHFWMRAYHKNTIRQIDFGVRPLTKQQ